MKKKNNNSKLILIATKNKDKFLIVSNMLKRVGLKNYKFINLQSLKIHEDVKEKGTIMQRAKQKADFYQKIILEKKITEVIAILGIDDGIKLFNRKRINSNSKEIADGILSGKLSSIGNIIFVVRAFALNLMDNKIQTTCITHIPFVFLGNIKNVKRNKEKYPLSHVFGMQNRKKSIIETSEKECLEYYLKYSKKELIKLCQILPER